MEEKVRILIVMASPFIRGLAPENYIRAKAVYEIPNTKVDIMCFPDGDNIEAPNVRILRVPKKRLFKSFQIGEYKKIIVYTLWMTFKLLFKKDKRYDIIFLYNAAYLFFWLIKPMYKGKVIATIYASLAEEMAKWNISRNTSFQNTLKKYEILILSKYDKLIFNMLQILKEYESRGLDRRTLVLIPHASDRKWHEFKEVEKRNVFNVLYAGSFVPVQNLSLLYQTAKLIDDAKVQFILVGATDEDFSNEIKKISDLGLNNVTIHRKVGQAELEEYYNMADILISCRVTGNDLPFKIIEYMSWGECILASDRPIHNMVLNKEISCLVEPDPHIMASHLINLMENPILRSQYEKMVKIHFQKFFSFDRMKRDYDLLLKEVS